MEISKISTTSDAIFFATEQFDRFYHTFNLTVSPMLCVDLTPSNILLHCLDSCDDRIFFTVLGCFYTSGVGVGGGIAVLLVLLLAVAVVFISK